MRFVPVPAPCSGELQDLVQVIAERIGRSLERSGLITRDMENCYLACDPSEGASIDTLLGHSITYRIASGPRQLEDRPNESSAGAESWESELPCRIQHRGNQVRIVIAAPDQTANRKPDPIRLRMLQRAHQWREQLESGDTMSTNALGKLNGVNGSYFTRIVRLTYLSPDIVDSIVDGRQPTHLTTTRLMQIGDLPVDWAGQRRQLGFPPV